MAYRVIQWATGAMGKACLRAILDHPDLELAGLYAYSDSKIGRDAGEIARRDPVGVTATGDINEILDLEADVVVHAARIQPPYTHHNRTISRLLASGKNVISINGHTYPRYWGSDYAEEFESACREGGSTLFGTGLNPGFIAEKVALVASGICQRIDHIMIDEVVECTMVRNPNYVFDVLGFGSEVGKINPNDPTWPPATILNGMYAEVIALLAERMGFKLDRIAPDHRMLPATTDIEMAAGLIRQGTVSHTNWRWHGIIGKKPLMTLSIDCVMETAHLTEPEFNLWNIRISGLPGIKIAIDLTKPANYQFKTGPEELAVAGSVINSIPAVCDAEPGVMTVPMGCHFKADF